MYYVDVLRYGDEPSSHRLSATFTVCKSCSPWVIRMTSGKVCIMSRHSRAFSPRAEQIGLGFCRATFVHSHLHPFTAHRRVRGGGGVKGIFTSSKMVEDIFRHHAYRIRVKLTDANSYLEPTSPDGAGKHQISKIHGGFLGIG